MRNRSQTISGKPWGVRYELASARPCAVLALCIAMWSCCSVHEQPACQTGNVMPIDTDIYVLIDRLQQLPRFDPTSLRQVFGVTPRQKDDPGNPYIRIFAADVGEASPVQRLELRIPADNAAATQALLILTIRAGRGTAIDEVRRRFGPAAGVELPRAAAPAGTPTYERYDYPWGHLTFGYLPTDNRLREVIFDRK